MNKLQLKIMTIFIDIKRVLQFQLNIMSKLQSKIMSKRQLKIMNKLFIGINSASHIVQLCKIFSGKKLQ